MSSLWHNKQLTALMESPWNTGGVGCRLPLGALGPRRLTAMLSFLNPFPLVTTRGLLLLQQGVFFQLLSLNFQISLEVVKTKNEMLPVHNTKSTSAHFLTQLSQCDITCLPPERLLNCNGLVLQHKICWGYLLCKSPRRPKSVDPAGVSHTRMWIVKQI